MRTREEIEKSYDEYKSLGRNGDLVLEVLLDIRDLLEKSQINING